VFDTQTPSDLSFDDPLTMNSNYPIDDICWCCGDGVNVWCCVVMN
jgi:hypothetical protein